jgi:hypothetical protein
LKKGVEVNVKAGDGLTALKAAKGNGHTDIVKMLEKAEAKE